jgi:hypothetical protein
MSLTREEKKAKKNVARYFKGIGKRPYKTPFHMKFTDGVNVFKEEDDDVFTSLNYVVKILKKIRPSFYSKIMTKPQAIRFIRITEQYMLLNRYEHFTFLIPDNFPFEITDDENSLKFLKRINERFLELRETFKITEEDIVKDTPNMLKLSGNNSNSNKSNSNNSNSNNSNSNKSNSNTSNSNNSNSNTSNSNNSLVKPKPFLNIASETVSKPLKVFESVKVSEPVKLAEPVKVFEPVKVSEPVIELKPAPEPIVELKQVQPPAKLNDPYEGIDEENRDFIIFDYEMVEYELSLLDKEDKERIRQRIEEDKRTYKKDIALIEKEAKEDIDEYIRQTVEQYKNYLISIYKNNKKPYAEARERTREQIISDFKLRLPNIRNNYFLSEYIMPKIDLWRLLKIRKRMDEQPKQKTYTGINLKHYTLKDRRNIEDKLEKGVPVHQIRQEYKPQPRKAQRPKTQTNRQMNGWQPNMRLPTRGVNTRGVNTRGLNTKGPNTRRLNNKGPNTRRLNNKEPNNKGQASRRKNPKPKVRTVFRVEPVIPAPVLKPKPVPRGRRVP